jgi:hypothetical protein
MLFRNLRNLITNSCLAYLNNSKLIKAFSGVLLFYSHVRTVVNSFKWLPCFGMRMVVCYMSHLPETKDSEISWAMLHRGYCLFLFSLILLPGCLMLGFLLCLFLSKMQMFHSYFHCFYETLILVFLFCVNSKFFLLFYILINISCRLLIFHWYNHYDVWFPFSFSISSYAPNFQVCPVSMYAEGSSIPPLSLHLLLLIGLA